MTDPDDPPSVVQVAIKLASGVIHTLPRPARHLDLEFKLRREGVVSEYPLQGQKGFLLSDGSFANRSQARCYAEVNGQLLPTAQKSNELISEDVW